MGSLWSKMKIRDKLLASFAVIGLIIMTVGFFNYKAMKNISNEIVDIDESQSLIKAVMSMQRSVDQTIRWGMEMMVSKSEEELEEGYKEIKKLIEEFDHAIEAMEKGG
ncbi:MAG: hypothetical protein ACD_79C00504G0009, partial [uncultured bacterium]